MRNIILAAFVLFVTGCDENGAIIVPETVGVEKPDIAVGISDGETDSYEVVVDETDTDTTEETAADTDIAGCDLDLFGDIYAEMALDDRYANKPLSDCIHSEGASNPAWCDEAISILECWTEEHLDQNWNGRDEDQIGASGLFVMDCRDVEAVRGAVNVCDITIGIPQ